MKNGKTRVAYSGNEYYSLLEPLAVNISRLYPGWRMRIYHNVTEDDEVFPHMCDLYCRYPHVDTCDMRHHPTEGDLQGAYPAGMMWRFLVMLKIYCQLKRKGLD